MKKRILVLIIGLCIFLGGYFAGHSMLPVAHAQITAPTITIPASWGHCLGTAPNPMGSGLLFEDDAGNLYLSDIQGNLQARYVRR